jgi:hypothetical protein
MNIPFSQFLIIKGGHINQNFEKIQILIIKKLNILKNF